MSRSYNTKALVLRRTNGRDTDRIVTIFTEQKGKVVTVAKGARKLSSRKRAHLEPGMLINCQIIETKGLPLLIQATMIEEFSGCRSQLAKIRQLSQVLEIVNALFVEEEPEVDMFDSVVALVRMIDSGKTVYVRDSLANLIANLGFQSFADTKHTSIHEYVSEITGKPLRSWEYLRLE